MPYRTHQQYFVAFYLHVRVASSTELCRGVCQTRRFCNLWCRIHQPWSTSYSGIPGTKYSYECKTTVSAYINGNSTRAGSRLWHQHFEMRQEAQLRMTAALDHMMPPNGMTWKQGWRRYFGTTKNTHPTERQLHTYSKSECIIIFGDGWTERQNQLHAWWSNLLFRSTYSRCWSRCSTTHDSVFRTRSATQTASCPHSYTFTLKYVRGKRTLTDR